MSRIWRSAVLVLFAAAFATFAAACGDRDYALDSQLAIR